MEHGTATSSRASKSGGASAPPLFALLEQFDTPGPRYTSYPTAAEFNEAAVDSARYRAALDDLGRRGSPTAAYVHVPFCTERCTYCACNVVASPLGDRVALPYLDDLERELRAVSEAIGAPHPLDRVHLGGGTPTYLSPKQLARLVGAMRDRFTWTERTEASVEVDPRVTREDHIRVLGEHGFRRLSVGVQDLDPRVQQAIGRVQSESQTRSSIEQARAHGFTSVNADLVYGLPHQTLASLSATLDAILRVDPDRLAVYSFAFLPKAFAHQRRMDADAIPRGRDRVALLNLVRQRLLEAGYVDIGIDHFARPDDPLAMAQRAGKLRRDFMGYTERAATDYLGFGVSAIGHVGDAYFQNHKKLSRYRAALDAGALPITRGCRLDQDDVIRAEIISDIMCNFRLDVRRVVNAYGAAAAAVVAEGVGRMRPLAQRGFVEVCDAEIVVTEPGRYVARAIARCFDAYRAEEGSGAGFSSTL